MDSRETPPVQDDLFDGETEVQVARSLLDRLIGEARLYRTGEDYQDLLTFVARLRLFAPFNAMLLHLQKPGLTYAASQADWWGRFGRTLEPGARPLLVMRIFGPVALVYDVADTRGPALPIDVDPFAATGSVDESMLREFRARIKKKGIAVARVDAGAGSAGSIGMARAREAGRYLMTVNRNHAPPAEFTTIAHELAHLFLGHLGEDKRLRIRSRPGLPPTQREIEAESVAYLVAERNGVESRSHPYLSTYVDAPGAAEALALDQIMVATGRIEALLGVAVQARFDPLQDDMITTRNAA